MSGITVTGGLNGANDATVIPQVIWSCDCHLRVNSYHSLMAGLDATTEHPGAYLTVEEDEFHTVVTWHLDRLALEQRCGTYQADVERWAGDAESGNGTYSFGVDCGTVGVLAFASPAVFSSVPESSSLMLCVLGAVCLASVRRRVGRWS